MKLNCLLFASTSTIVVQHFWKMHDKIPRGVRKLGSIQYLLFLLFVFVFLIFIILSSNQVVVPVQKKVIEKEIKPIPWWILLVTIIVALLLLAFVVFILYKVCMLFFSS